MADYVVRGLKVKGIAALGKHIPLLSACQEVSFTEMASQVRLEAAPDGLLGKYSTGLLLDSLLILKRSQKLTGQEL